MSLDVQVRKCSHPRDLRIRQADGGWQCGVEFCFHVASGARVRRGKSARRLGTDGERRTEKRYGWVKTGEYGGINDHVGTMAVVQQKTTREGAPKTWLDIYGRLERNAGGKIPLILFSFVKQGTPTQDFILIRGADWLALHGKDAAE